MASVQLREKLPNYVFVIGIYYFKKYVSIETLTKYLYQIS